MLELKNQWDKVSEIPTANIGADINAVAIMQVKHSYPLRNNYLKWLCV